MAEFITPPIPPVPTGTDWQAWDVYLRAVAESNRVADAAIRADHAKAQADTAAAMLLHVEAQRAMVAAMSEPAPIVKPSRGELVLRLLPQEPNTIKDTSASVVARVKEHVDAFAKAFPDAVRD